MIVPKATHTVKGPRRASREAVRRAVRILQQTQIWVGIPDGVPTPTDAKVTEAQLLFIQEHGVRRKAMRDAMAADLAGHTYEQAYNLYIQEHGSPLWQIPPRPVLRPALAKARPRLMRIYARAVQEAWSGVDPTRTLQVLAYEAASSVRDFFNDPANGLVPNAPETIRRKGSDRPLVDTGAMRDSIVGQLRMQSRVRWST